MKLLITTRADNNINKISDLTIPLIKQYAIKYNADFYIISSRPPILTDDDSWHFRVMELFKLLNNYDRILLLDCDLIIKKDCPNLFEIVPEDSIGSVIEDNFGWRKEERRMYIRKMQEQFGDLGWKEGHINDSVFVVSKIHQSIFQPINGKYYTGPYSDDIHLGWQIHKQKFKIFELDPKFNMMRCFWENGYNRLDGYIIHYAGFPLEKRYKMIVNDLTTLYPNEYFMVNE